MGATVQATRISSWGNSDAVRIPRSLLRLAGLKAGDDVDIVVNERSNIEIVPKAKSHRRVKPAKGVTFDSLFAGYESSDKPIDYSSPWLGDDLVGAEYEAWSR